ncbi:MAG: PspC domain-containing protein [Bacteroidia bacterium]|jgi:phage shock protein PspC (stress-responsive transcriptional regulator)|nr:PspC domain-containing protein [Bacteroidia bacterium]
MNKVVTINLNGIIISIDEEAYTKLKAYLDVLHNHYQNTEGGAEIVSDIESRIAEILQSKLNLNYQAILLSDIEEVIKVMGYPEEMNEGKEFDSNTTSGQHQKKFRRDETNKIVGGVCSGIANYIGIDPLIIRAAFFIALFVFGSGVLLYIIIWAIVPAAKPEELVTAKNINLRRLFRNGENKMVGGVCSGIANYLDIDELWIRLVFAFAVFFAGTGVLAYFILWAIIPEAKTTAEKLQMKGKSIHISNIEKEIRQASTNIIGQSNDIFARLTGWLKIVLAFVISVAIISMLFPALAMLAFIHFGLSDDNPLTIWVQNMLIIPSIYNYIKWGITLLVASVFVSLIGFALRLFFKFKYRFVSLLSAVLLISAGILLVQAGVSYYNEIDNESSFTGDEISIKAVDTITVALRQQSDEVNKFDVVFKDDANDEADINNSTGWIVKGDKLWVAEPKIYIKHQSKNSIDMLIKKSAVGNSKTKAEEHASNIDINLSTANNIILLNELINPGNVKGFYHQKAELGIKAPVGTIIRFQTAALRLVDDVDFDFNEEEASFNTYVYTKVTDEGLVCLSCEEKQLVIETHEEIVVTDSTSNNGKTRITKTTKRYGPFSIELSETKKK